MQGTERQAHIRVTGQPWGAGELSSTIMNDCLRSKAYSRTVAHGQVNEALLFRGGTSTDFYLPMPDQSSAPLQAPPINFQTPLCSSTQVPTSDYRKEEPRDQQERNTSGIEIIHFSEEQTHLGIRLCK